LEWVRSRIWSAFDVNMASPLGGCFINSTDRYCSLFDCQRSWSIRRTEWRSGNPWIGTDPGHAAHEIRGPYIQYR
jgi:hypothetical protein